MLEHMINFGGKNYSPGAENTVVDITPPPCLWIPEGDAHTGSQYVIDFYDNTDPGPSALFDGEHAFQEAKQLVNQNPIPPGTWYELPVNPNDTQAQVQQCLNAAAVLLGPARRRRCPGSRCRRRRWPSSPWPR